MREACQSREACQMSEACQLRKACHMRDHEWPSSPAITCNHLQSSAITCSHLQSPAITCNHYNHCNHEWPSSPAIASSMSSTRWRPARLPAATSAEHVASLAPTGVPMTAERTLRPPPSADSAELRRTATGGHRRPTVSNQACNQGSPQ